MELQELIRRLQEEKCSSAVLDRVSRRVSRGNAPARVWRRPSLAWAASIACLVGVAALWQWDVRRDARRAAAQTSAERALVVQQSQEAFGHIAHALLRVAAQTEDVLLKDAVPPLRDGFETVKSKVINPI